ncbi:MAG: ATP-binding protein [Candidatus Dormibacteraceae bacterium]
MNLSERGIVSRHLEMVIAQRLSEEPVVILNGTRTVGKSTLLRGCARARGVEVFDLDDLTTRHMVMADPAFFITAPEPVCIDEFQHVLPVLDAIKAELNRDLRAGRYLLTGSTRYMTLPVASQSLTGRAHIIRVWPLSQGELRGVQETFLDTLVNDPAELITATPSTTTRQTYEQLVLAGGLPIALARTTAESRRRWFRDFVEMVIQRDVLEFRKVRQREVLPEILRRLAAQSSQLLNSTTVANSIQLEKSTVNDFIQLLESVFLIHRLGAYGRTLSARVNHSPKVHLVDSGLAAYLLGVTENKLAARESTTLTEFGHILETFVVNELLKQAGWAQAQFTFGHFRMKDAQEVDLVCETDDGRIAGVEVKAASRVLDEDFRGLRLLRERLGRAFVGGVLLYLGSRSYVIEDRLYVLPLDRLWGGL